MSHPFAAPYALWVLPLGTTAANLLAECIPFEICRKWMDFLDKALDMNKSNPTQKPQNYGAYIVISNEECESGNYVNPSWLYWTWRGLRVCVCVNGCAVACITVFPLK